MPVERYFTAPSSALLDLFMYTKAYDAIESSSIERNSDIKLLEITTKVAPKTADK
jgi:hypothetical protein